MRHIPPRNSDPLKDCLNCGQSLTRKNYNGRLEDFTVFSKRKFCSRTCMGQFKTKDLPTDSTLLKRYKIFKKEKCENCGSMSQLGVHHKDKNRLNNSEENLQTLCASCHTKLHWEEDKITNPETTMKPCSICGKITRTHGGMCQKHYQRFKKYGDPYLTKPVGGSKLKKPIKVTD